MEKQSRYGRGLTYCLGLFLAHTERTFPDKGVDLKYRHWFDGASDHLYELEIPETLPKIIQARLYALREKALKWGHARSQMGTVKITKVTEEDKEWALNEALLLLRAIDRQLGVKTTRGVWE